MTGLMLVALRYGGASVLRGFILLASVYIAFFALDVLVPAVVEPTVGGVSVNLLAVGGALGLGGALYAYPEWYVVDTAGVVMGIGAAGLFGINFGVTAALVLLSVLAVYDAISVYGTEHMLTLASGVMEMRVPVVLVVPLSLSYSYLDAEPPETAEAPGEGSEGDPTAGGDPEDSSRDALFIGLGDAIIPTVLVASVAFFVDAGPTVSLLVVEASLPAVTAMVGTLLGLVVLLWLVTRGRAHAGLPLLNGGAIAGYLVGALASGLTLAEAVGVSGLL